MLSVQTLLGFDVSRLAPAPASSASGANAALQTILDRADDWLVSQSFQPGLRGLALNNLFSEAEELLRHAWQPSTEQSAVRAAETLRASAGFRMTEATRRAGCLVRALLRHRTLAICFGPAFGPVLRYQRALVFFTCCLAILATDVLAYWQRATECCREIRALLSCPPDPSVPCRQFTGDCADLPSVFSALPDVPAGVASFTCRAYPDSAKWSERFIVCAIMMAISFGTRVTLERVFEVANAAPEPGVRLLCLPCATRILLQTEAALLLCPVASRLPFQSQRLHRVGLFPERIARPHVPVARRSGCR